MLRTDLFLTLGVAVLMALSVAGFVYVVWAP
jgi:hypothetical protein